ncbi:hypothetical protein FH039_06510 [Thermococcus indicus]|uniref:DUF2268 domain-containing protein n=1 Tax=Thermococcus indicus TaxID=2586643 RepID=A0A4Y5SK39_9EURY|nr:hypothetical protein [Thermococcus indicus]QDA31317.1 hypothetical protein FH039_06510 [Thermococcus indicus]
MIFDTFQDFMERWDGSPEGWIAYISGYPELFEKIKADYAGYGASWRDYLRLLDKRKPEEFNKAYECFMGALPKIAAYIERLFGITQDDYNIVIYVGLENGAGWVTEFKGKPAILFGLEAVAELGWYDGIAGLIAHEFGHLVHWLMRNEDLEKLEENAIMGLYTEGFAQRVEDSITGRPWHLEYDGWFEWCTRNERRIKEEFARRVRENEPLNPFFGSWYELFGMKFTGYYLGYRFIRWLEETLSFEEIAKLEKEKVRGMILEFLEG